MGRTLAQEEGVDFCCFALTINIVLAYSAGKLKTFLAYVFFFSC